MLTQFKPGHLFCFPHTALGCEGSYGLDKAQGGVLTFWAEADFNAEMHVRSVTLYKVGVTYLGSTLGHR